MPSHASTIPRARSWRRRRTAQVVAACIAAVVALLGVTTASAATRTATNVATFSYQLDASGPVQTVSSNVVTLAYPDHVPASTPSRVEFLALSGGAAPIVADGARCRAADGVFVAVPPLTNASGAPVPTASVALQATGSVHAGDPIFIRLTDANSNLDPAVRDTVDLRLTNGLGDEEVIRVLETGPDTGVFVGAVQSAALSSGTQANDCRLTVAPNATITVSYVDALYPTDIASASVLVDPYGVVFDAANGLPVNGATVTLIASATGRPADVRGDDGVVAYPSTVVSGGTVTDGAGRGIPMPTGGFRFPFVAAGDYVLRVTPPPGYLAPSSVAPAALLALHADGGEPFTIGPASFGERFAVPVGDAVKVDIPIDAVAADLVLQKTASIATASTGDNVQYRIAAQNRSVASVRPVVVDRLPRGLRYRAGSLRIDGARMGDPVIAADGRTMTLPPSTIVPNGRTVVSYVAQVIAGAPLGDAINDAWATVNGATVSNVASVAVKLRPPLFSDRFTIVGRVVSTDCGAPDATASEADGLAGARLVLDDGTYVVTDRDGLYHFEAVRPGTHVVQLDLGRLHEAFEAVACVRNTRFAGSATSQFVEADGGGLMRADFHVRRRADAKTSADVAATPAARAAIVDEATAAGGKARWLDGRAPGIEWVFPDIDHNPRAPVVRVAIKHDADQTVRLSGGGSPVAPLAFDGTEVSADRTYAVSVWRGLPLVDGDNRFDADIVSADGRVVARLGRVVHYANAPVRAEFVPDQSTLVADGVHKPVLAVRFLDRIGRPVRAGLIGPYRINAPYTAALAVDLQQTRQLAGLDRNPMQYKVEGDDGIAYIELAPTTDSGAVVLQLEFERGLAGSQARTQEIRTWLASDARDWIVVGFAKGTVGYDRLQAHAEALPDGERNGVETSGQVSLYAKGRILGDWLMTLAYDSAKPAAERQRDSLLGVIDPRQFYTLYGDGSQQRPDAASASKLYLKLERDQFQALFGDFETGLTQSKLARYSRTLNGVKTEFHGAVAGLGIGFVGFASDTAQGYGRDEMLGNGTSGLYRLSQPNLLVNSEQVRIETRDRFRSEVIVDSHAMTRGLDYDIDYTGGTLFFREPIASRDVNLNPVFIVVEYETEGAGTRKLTAGGRGAIDWLDGRVTTGLSAIRDANSLGTTELVGVDARVKLPADTELRIETARSRGDRPLSYASQSSGSAHLVELEHNDANLNAIAYLRRQDPGFGLSQQNAIESGTSKAGVDAQYQLGPDVKLTGQAYRLTNLGNGAERVAGSGLLEYRALPWTLRVGAVLANDTATDRDRLASRQVTAGVSRTFLDNRLELSAQADVSIGGRDQSADYPSRYQLAATYALTERWKLIGAEEYAAGATFHALTTRVGMQADPWKDARVTGTVNQSAISEYGPRTFGVLGLKQSLPLDDHWSIDAAVDGSRSFHGSGPAASATSGALTAPGAFGDSTLSSSTAHGSSSLVTSVPSSASGTYANGSNAANVLASLTENFTAVSAGATYRQALWTWTGRIETRNGQLSDRHGLSTAFLRQAEAGVAFAGIAQVFAVSQSTGVRGLIARGDLSWAWRPLAGRWSALDKLEFKLDRLVNPGGSVDGSLFGANSLQSSGNVRSTRLVNNLAINGVGKPWTEPDREGDLFTMQQRNQWSVYYGSKVVFDRYDEADYKGYTDLIGFDGRIDVTSRVDLGARVNVLHAWSSRTTTWSAGPSIGVVPFANAWISVGYNLRGFRDRDFGATNYTARGPYVTFRFKLDPATARDVASTLTPR